jgi:peptide/nickel transport system substrate-binding protein
MIVSYALERYEDYHDGSAYIDNIIFKFYNDYSNLIEALNQEEIDNISFIPPEEIEKIKPEIQDQTFFYNLRLPRYYALFFNEPENELLSEKEVRQALAYGTNKQVIIDSVFQGQAVEINSPILENFLGYNPEIKKYEYNKDKANEILHQAGFDEINDKGYRKNGDEVLKFTITTTNQKEFSALANLLKEQWKEIGINVKIEALDPTELQTDYLRPRNYEILLYGQLLGHDPDPYPFWHSSQRTDPGLNLTSFKDTDVDDLLETARKTSKEDERQKKYIHFQNIIAEEMPAIFICSPTYPYGLTKKIRGVELDFITIPSDRFSDIKNWFVKIDRRWK